MAPGRCGSNFVSMISKPTIQKNSLAWWRHQMETFSALLAICAGNSLVPGEVPAQRPVTRCFDVFFDLRLNKRLSKQSCPRLVMWDAIVAIMTSLWWDLAVKLPSGQWMPPNLTNENSTLVHVMAWCLRATWAKVDPDLCHGALSFSQDPNLVDFICRGAIFKWVAHIGLYSVPVW